MRIHWLIAALLAAPLLAGGSASAEVTVRIGDVTTLQGQRVNRLVGMGLVVGLNGTGDGDQYEITTRALAQSLGNLGSPVATLEDLKNTKNVAIVMVDATIPEYGVREGNRIDVHLSALGSAKSLLGGRLLATPLMYHDINVEKIFAYGSGPIHLPDPANPTVGVVKLGATVEEDVLVAFTAFGRELPFTTSWIQPGEMYITLVLDEAHAGWALATAIAEAINAELALSADVERVAVAADPKNVLVSVPGFQRSDPASWIRDILELSTLMPTADARVTIDRKSGTITVSGDARISPVVVSQKGLTVTVRIPTPAPDDPRVESQQFIALDTNRDQQAHVADLLQALNQLKVPVRDRIAILSEIQRAGKLHAKLLYQE